MPTATLARVPYPLDQTALSASAFDVLKQWIHEHEITQLEVTTDRDGRLRTSTGDAEIIEGAMCAPAQVEHIASSGSTRAIVVATRIAWPAQIDEPPSSHGIFFNPSIIEVVGYREG